MRTTAILALLFLSVSCASSGVGPVRFHNAPIVTQVNDRVDTPKPERRRFAKALYHLDNFLLRRLTRLMEVPEGRRAMNTNALDEVPDSTWFTNRIGVRDLTPEEIFNGPGNGKGPSLHEPWRVTGTKVGGASVGMLMKDPDDKKYLLKFDQQGIPETETGAHVVVQRLLWAIGFNVPDDNIVYLPRAQLVLDENASKEDVFGDKVPMMVEDLEEQLAKVNRDPDGRYRGLVSRFLSGYPLGGVAREGIRDDDPNDLFPHEHRRELRGARLFFGWLSHTDVKEDNTLDMWVEDPVDPDRHYIKHYLVDFGKALGNFGYIERQESDSYAHLVDIGINFTSLFTLGLWVRPWEGADGPGIPGVARFEAERFHPDDWRPRYPYVPFAYTDKFDSFWATKTIMRFTPEQIQAAVSAGRFRDPRATSFLTRTLVQRQRKIGQVWFRRVNPLDRFVLGDGELCFDDLLHSYDLQLGEGISQYRVVVYDEEGVPRGDGQIVKGPGERLCAPVEFSDSYNIITVTTDRADPRDDHGLAPVEVHVATRDGQHAIIGIRRQ